MTAIAHTTDPISLKHLHIPGLVPNLVPPGLPRLVEALGGGANLTVYFESDANLEEYRRIPVQRSYGELGLDNPTSEFIDEG